MKKVSASDAHPTQLSASLVLLQWEAALIKSELYLGDIPDVRSLVACPEVDSSLCEGIYLLSRC